MLTVNKHGGIGCDCIEAFQVHGGTLIYPTVLTGHIREHHHVALPRWLSLQKANIYWLIHKHPKVNSLSTLHCNRSGKILLLKNIEVFLRLYGWLKSQNPCSHCPGSEARPNPLLWFCPWATPPKCWRMWRGLGQREELNICPQYCHYHPRNKLRQVFGTHAPQRCLRPSQSKQQTVRNSPWQ